jgi:hypothetical protein
MDQSLDTLVARIIAAERVTPEDTTALRQLVWTNAMIHRGQAEAVFSINAAVKKHCPQWVDFFVEVITTYLVEQIPPHGYVDDDNARWLINQIGKDGKLESRAELLLIVSILEKAENVADSLKDYAVAQVERAVLTGEGPTRIGSAPRVGVIDEAEVALLRRILFAPGSDGASIISEKEARMLFRIKDATLGADNAPGWQTLFVQLVGNHLMAHPVSHQMSQTRAMELDRFMNDTIPGVGKFLGRMEAAFLHPSQAWKSASIPAPDNSDAAIAADLALTTDEANWLKAQIVADGHMDDIEKALLAFIIDESGPLPVAFAEPMAMRA